MASGAPKDVLVDPARFGRLPDASLRPWDPTSSAAWGIVTRALAQHRLACAVSGHLRATRMTQARLAAAIGRRPGTLSKQLNGHDWMVAEDVCAIAHALGRIDWLDVRHLQSALRDAAEGSPPHGGGRGPAGWQGGPGAHRRVMTVDRDTPTRAEDGTEAGEDLFLTMACEGLLVDLAEVAAELEAAEPVAECLAEAGARDAHGARDGVPGRD